LNPSESALESAAGSAQAEADRLYAAHFQNSPWRNPARETVEWRNRPVSQRALDTTRLTPCRAEGAAQF